MDFLLNVDVILSLGEGEGEMGVGGPGVEVDPQWRECYHWMPGTDIVAGE